MMILDQPSHAWRTVLLVMSFIVVAVIVFYRAGVVRDIRANMCPLPTVGSKITAVADLGDRDTAVTGEVVGSIQYTHNEWTVLGSSLCHQSATIRTDDGKTKMQHFQVFNLVTLPTNGMYFADRSHVLRFFVSLKT